MPVKTSSYHQALLALPEALREAMAERKHTQNDVSALTNVAQPQISRILAGQRKRLSPAIVRLCQYADVDTTGIAQAHVEGRELGKLVAQIASASPQAARAVREVLITLAPFLLHPADKRDRLKGPSAEG